MFNDQHLNDLQKAPTQIILLQRVFSIGIYRSIKIKFAEMLIGMAKEIDRVT